MYEFLKNDRGNVAMMVGILVIPLLVGAGIAVDGWRAAETRAHFAEAVDAGLLAAARQKSINTSLSRADAEQLARRLFDENMKNRPVTVNQFDLTFFPATETFEIDAKADYPTTILRVVGFNAIPLDTVARARYAPPSGLEIALVLDNTESMSGAKMTALKAAARDLTQRVMGAPNSQAKIAVIPFDQYVNVGVANRGQLWLDVEADSSTTTTQCRNTYPNRTQTGTRTETRTRCTASERYDRPCMRDGIMETCSATRCLSEEAYTVEVPVYDNGAPVSVCEPRTTTRIWRGCVGSRDAPLDIEDRDFVGSDRVPGLMNTRCATALLPLTDDEVQVTAKIDAMSAARNTYMPAGIAWGLRALSSEAPFTGGATYADTAANGGVKALIFMTDGINSLSATYPRHDGSNQADANNQTRGACDAAKDEGVRVFTIAFDVPDAATRLLLEACASDIDHYYDSANAAELSEAFREIADSLSNLALTG